MTRNVLRHFIHSYGRLSSVWSGILFTVLSTIILKGIVALVVAQILGAILDRSASALDYVWWLFLALVSATILGATGDYIFVKGTDARYKDLVGFFYRDLMAKDVGFFRKEKVGALSALFRDYLDGTINVFRILRTEAFPALLSVFLPIAILAYFDGQVAAIVLVSALLQIALSIGSARRVKTLRSDAHKVYRELSGIVADHIVHLAVIRASAREDENRRVVVELAEAEARLFWRRHGAVIRFDCLKGLISATCFAGVFWILVAKYSATSEFARLAVVSALYVIQSMASAHGYAEVIQRISEHLSRVTSALGVLSKEARSMKWPARTGAAEPMLKGEVIFERVSFAYCDSGLSHDRVKSVFSDLNLTIPEGSHVALVGASGAGKSTIAHLILRFDDATAGTVKIGGLDLRNVSPSSLYHSISYVPQQPGLLNATILENLRLYVPEANEAAVWEACRIACADDFIRNLEGGLQYQVGEFGKRLSGGQRQRVALARALLRDSPLYILDEVTSELDEQTAAAVVANLKVKLLGKTMILIAHSGQIAAMMDTVLVVQNRNVQRLSTSGAGRPSV